MLSRNPQAGNYACDDINASISEPGSWPAARAMRRQEGALRVLKPQESAWILSRLRSVPLPPFSALPFPQPAFLQPVFLRDSPPAVPRKPDLA